MCRLVSCCDLELPSYIFSRPISSDHHANILYIEHISREHHHTHTHPTDGFSRWTVPCLTRSIISDTLIMCTVSRVSTTVPNGTGSAPVATRHRCRRPVFMWCIKRSLLIFSIDRLSISERSKAFYIDRAPYRVERARSDHIGVCWESLPGLVSHSRAWTPLGGFPLLVIHCGVLA